MAAPTHYTGKAVVLTASGGIECLKTIPDHTVRSPKAGEVLIKLVATSVNPVDVYVRSGMYASPVFPKVIGGDASGHVFAVGEGSKFKVGDAVYALSNSYVPYNEFEGTYAEYALFKEEWVAPAPSADVLSLTHAAGVPLVALTAVQALDKADKAIGGLKGKRILVLGASGGVGQFAVQLAKAEHGMHVTAVCSAKQSDFVKSLGADETWDYKLGIDNLKATYSAAEKQFDVVLDVIGEELLAAAMSGGILKSGGVVTHIMNRGSKGADKEYTAASEAGTGPKFVTTLVEPSGDQLSRLTQLFNEKKLRLKVAQQMPLEEVGKAQELVIEGHAGGKVVLTI